jgi:surfactin synthase thioesterase subunit
VNDKSSNKWILFPRPNPAAALRSFWFHYSGGGAPIFNGWPGRPPSSMELAAIQLPGRGHRLGEPHIRRLLSLSRIIAQELLPYLDKPFVFSVTAWERCCALKRRAACAARIGNNRRICSSRPPRRPTVEALSHRPPAYGSRTIFLQQFASNLLELRPQN